MDEQQQPRLAWLACASCSERKRKCDRVLPQCGLCLRAGRECGYLLSLPEAGHQQRAQLCDSSPLFSKPTRSQQSQSSPDSSLSSSASKAKPSNFPVALFLDSILFTHCGTTLPIPSQLPSTVLLSHIGDAEESRRIAGRYFDTLHPPLAFISKTRFYGVLLSSPFELRSDVALLVLCMKLIMSEPRHNNMRPDATELYWIAKEHMVEIELSKALTICVLQSALLIALYEIGHGIYPSAYLTVGLCARYGTALGLGQELSIFENAPGRWIEQEERNRAWWAVLILDRHIHIGSPNIPLSTPDPPLDALLPVEDEEWNWGEWREREPIRLASAATAKIGRFARVVQAMNLLSMSISMAADVNIGKYSSKGYLIQLDRTVKALATLNATEAELRATLFCVSHTICVDALIIIHSRFLLETKQDGTNAIGEQSLTILASISRQSEIVLSGLLEGKRGRPEQYCPLLFGWIYRSAAVSISLNHVKPCEEYSLRIQTSKQALGVIGSRWKVADYYLELLDKRHLTMAPLTMPR